ncbi:MAG TPA: hypothetical protein ENN28_02255, partial [Candidatus Uhrbacteria bacterium]|nr:hypothetical protein [Candidatus Uhrbacteria bacterium]
MVQKLRRLIFLKLISSKAKLILVLAFFLALTSFFSRDYLQPVKADILSYNEDFSTEIFKDNTATTGKWDTVLQEARLLGKDWFNMGETASGYENISQTPGHSLFYVILFERHSEDMQLDSDDKPYIVWRDNTVGEYEIYFSRWTEGIGWTSMDGSLGADNLSNSSAFSYRQVIQLDSGNNPYVVWEDGIALGNGDIYFSKWTESVGWTKMDGTLGYDNLSNDTSAKSTLPLLRLDSSGNPLVVWQDERLGVWEIFLTKWTDGVGWTKMDGTLGYDNISNTADSSGLPQLQLDSNSFPYVIWEDPITGSYEIYFSKWTDGVGWTKMDGTLGYDNISNTAGDSTTAKLILNAADKPYLVWQDNATGNNEIYFSKWTDGVGWSKMDGMPGYDNISNNAGASVKPQIQLDISGNPFVVWQDNTTGNDEIYFSKWTDGVGWSKMDGTPGYDNISNNAGVSIVPLMQLDAGNNPLVVWQDDSEGNYEVYVSKWTAGTGWTKMDGTPGYDNISNNSGNSRTPIIRLDSSGQPHIVWEDDTEGNREIYFSKWLYYKSSSIIQSLNVNSTSDFVTSATLTASETLSGQIIDYYLSNNGGASWNSVLPGSLHVFSSVGSDLRWRAVLQTINPNTTPIIDDLSVVYNTALGVGGGVVGGVETLPNAPINLTCEAQSQAAIRWSFEDQADNETGFKLYDATTDLVVLDTLPNITTDLEYFDEAELEINSQYSRYVTAFSGAGESGPSNTAACYTLANKPLGLEILETGEEEIVLRLKSGDGNPEYTEYAIKELNTGNYVQTDGSFGDTEAWQTQEAWGEIRVTGAGYEYEEEGLDYQISLTPGEEYDFSAKARNGDGIETEFSASTTALA